MRNDRAKMAMKNRKFKIHILQWTIQPGQVDRNLRKAESLLDRSNPDKDDLILLPEMFSSGFYYSDLKGMAGESDRVLAWMSGLASSRSVAMVGSLPMSDNRGVVNSMVMLDEEGRTVGSYDKVHLFPLAGEVEAFSEGTRLVAVDWKGLRVGLLICFDLRFPEAARKLCLEGAQLILVSAQWPAARVDHFRDLVRVRAMENQLVVAATNSCGEDGSGLVLGGRSLVTGPSGEVLGELNEGEGALAVEFDPEKTLKARRDFPVLSLRRPEVYE
jgi:predicted amidohydrolase